MKYFSRGLIIISVVLFAAILMEPTDEQCIYTVTRRITGVDNTIFNGLFSQGTKLVVGIRDRVCYKAIYDKMTGKLLGIGIFKQVLIF